MKQITNEKQLSEIIGTSNFSNLNDFQISQIMKLLPCIAKEVLIPIVSESRQLAVAMIDASKDALTKIVASANKSLEMQHETDLKTLEILKITIQREDLSSNERDSYIAQVIEINRNSAQRNSEHKEYLKALSKEHNFSSKQFWGFVAEIVVPIATPLIFDLGRWGISQVIKKNNK